MSGVTGVDSGIDDFDALVLFDDYALVDAPACIEEEPLSGPSNEEGGQSRLGEWFSWASWRRWGLVKMADKFVGSTGLLADVQARLPSSAVYTSCLMRQMACRALVQRPAFVHVTQGSGVVGSVWTEIDADQRVSVAVENLALIVHDNLRRRLAWLDEQPDQVRYVLNTARTFLKMADRHLDQMMDIAERLPGGLGEWEDWRRELGGSLHPALWENPKVRRDYFQKTADRIMALGLPDQAQDLYFLSAPTKNLLYHHAKPLVPVILEALISKLGERDTLNIILLNVLWKLRKESPVCVRQSEASCFVPKDSRLHRRVGAVSAKNFCLCYPTLGGWLYKFINLEGLLGRNLGPPVEKFLRSAKFVELADDLLNEVLASVAEGHYVEQETGGYRFEPKIRYLADGTQELELRPALHDSKDSLSLDEKVERELTIFIRGQIPQVMRGLWCRFSSSVDRFFNRLVFGSYLIRAKYRLGGAIGFLQRQLRRFTGIDTLVIRTLDLLIRPLAQSVLRFVHQRGHRNLILHLQDGMLDVLERDQERWREEASREKCELGDNH